MAGVAVNLEAEAYRRLYPDAFYAKFLAAGTRPDGRLLSAARATSVSIMYRGPGRCGWVPVRSQRRYRGERVL